MTEYKFVDLRRAYKRESEEDFFEFYKEYLIDYEEPNGNGGEPNGVPYSEGHAIVNLKNAGSLAHPSGYSSIGYYEKIGRRVFLDIRIWMQADWDAGSGGDEFWLDLEGPDEIVPDFTVNGCLESTGTFHGWGNAILEGNAYWSKNVGSGLDGIRVTHAGIHVSKNYPVIWGNGHHWRITLSYTV